MTYLQFHVIFLAPPLLALAAYVRRRPPADLPARARRVAIPATAAIAFVYTIPWDNYLVYADIWTYGPDRVIGTIGYVPVEEYLFFLLQPTLTGLWVFTLYAVSLRPRGRWLRARRPTHHIMAVLIFVFFIAITAIGVIALVRGERLTYLGLILAWAGPVLALLWIWKHPLLRAYGRLAVLAVAAPSLYLWVADRIAIGAGVWTITPATSTGWMPFGLPIEEAVFFLLTNLLCVFSVLIFLNPPFPSPTRNAR